MSEQQVQAKGATVVRELRCKLSPEALAAKGKALAASELKRSDIVERWLIKARDHRAKLKEMGEDIDQLAKDYESGEETRKVECRQEVEERTGVVRTYRTDMHPDDPRAFVEERALTADERQRWLPGIELPAAAQPTSDSPPPSDDEDEDEPQGNGTVRTNSKTAKKRRAARKGK